MRGVAGEAPFALDGRFDPGQQGVDGRHQRRQFAGEMAIRQRLQRIGSAGLERAADPLQRLQAVAHGEPQRDEGRHHGDQEGQEGGQRDVLE